MSRQNLSARDGGRMIVQPVDEVREHGLAVRRTPAGLYLMHLEAEPPGLCKHMSDIFACAPVPILAHRLELPELRHHSTTPARSASSSRHRLPPIV